MQVDTQVRENCFSLQLKLKSKVFELISVVKFKYTEYSRMGNFCRHEIFAIFAVGLTPRKHLLACVRAGQPASAKI